jgi:hypothetical protein
VENPSNGSKEKENSHKAPMVVKIINSPFSSTKLESNRRSKDKNRE